MPLGTFGMGAGGAWPGRRGTRAAETLALVARPSHARSELDGPMLGLEAPP